MKVSRQVTLYTEADQYKLIAQRKACKEGTPAQLEMDQKIFRCLRHLEKKEVEKNSKEQKKPQDQGYQKLLKYLWDSINATVSEYKKVEKKPSKARFNSYMRLLQQGSQLTQFGESSPAYLRYYKLAGLLLRELNTTEDDHNKDTFSYYATTSTLAELYMKVFRDNGIDPESSLVEAFEKQNEPLQNILMNRFFSPKAIAVNPAVVPDLKEQKSPAMK